MSSCQQAEIPTNAPADSDQMHAADSPKSHTSDDSSESGQTPSNGVRLLWEQARELKALLADYRAAKSDGVKLSLRNLILGIAFAAMSCITVSGLLIIAGWFVMGGLVGGLSLLFGDRLWLGSVTTGLLAAALVLLAMRTILNTIKRASLERTHAEHERRNERQRQRL